MQRSLSTKPLALKRECVFNSVYNFLQVKATCCSTLRLVMLTFHAQKRALPGEGGRESLEGWYCGYRPVYFYF